MPAMSSLKIGVHIRPQHTSVEAMRAAWRRADALGVDSITVWDHFYPLMGDLTGTHFECWSLFADMSNTPGSPEVLRQKNQVIDKWCSRVGRDPTEIERTCNIPAAAVEHIQEYVGAGAQRLQIQLDHPFDLQPVERALRTRG